MSVEQANHDNGDWAVACLVSLHEDPPFQLFQERSVQVSATSRPFSPLIPPSWTATTLSYLKDLEVLANKKPDLSKRTGQQQQKDQGSEASPTGSPIIGAELNAGDEAARNRMATLGSPISKRLSLSWLTLQKLQLSHTTDALHLCFLGGWTSMLMYRRPFLSILSKAHGLVDVWCVDSACPRLVPMPRAVANEMVLLSVLAPLMVSDLGAPFMDEVFSTDASDSMGAITSTAVPKQVVQRLSRSARTKGAYAGLKTPFELVMGRLGLQEEVDHQEVCSSGDAVCGLSVSRPLAFRYDFIEVYAGSYRVSQAMSALGFVVGPPIDIAFSEELDLVLTRVVSWLSFLLTSGNLGSIMVEPVCATFSRIRPPPLRSADIPTGFNVQCEKTRTGNILALRALFLLSVARQCFLPGLCEQPWTLMMRFLRQWQALEKKEGVKTTRTESCAFGSPHQKSFRFLSAWLDTKAMEERCDRSHRHVVVEGKYTKASASYTPKLARAIASCFANSIRARQSALKEVEDGTVKGLENQLVNAVAMRSPWLMRGDIRQKDTSTSWSLRVSCGWLKGL